MSGAEERVANDPTSELWGEHRARYRFACQLVRPGQSVLDVACGAGFGLRMLLDHGARPIGVDLQAPAVAEARAVAPQADLVQASAASLPLADHAVDLVVSFETLEHVPDAAAMLAELRRVLRPGGWLVVSTPNCAFGPPERHTGNPFHVREFTGDELRDLLGQHFDQVTLHGQWLSAAYRYVPFLLIQPDWRPRALLWKVQNRLPFGLKDALARLLTGRPFFPGECDYRFVPEAWQTAHALVAVAR